MLARSTVVRQAANAVRGNKFSILTLTEEFPNRGIVHSTPNAPVVQNQKLDNGIKFISRTRDGGLVHVRFAVLGGSSTESAVQKGAAHFLANAAYAGSGHNTGLHIVHTLEGLGASFSATADREKIVYDLSVLSNRADAAISTVLETISSAPLHNHVYQEHKDAAQLAYDEFHSSSCKKLRELVHEAAFGESSGFGGSLYASSLDKLNVADIFQYRAKHFVRENLVVAADGISSEHLKKILDNNSRQFSSGSAVTVPKAAFVGGEVKVRNNEEGTTHVAVAFGAPAGAAGVAYDVLFQTLTHRLQKKKICASTFQNKYHNGGLFGIQTNGGAIEIERILRAVIDELKAIAVDATGVEGARAAAGVASLSSLDSRGAASVLLDAYMSGSDVNAFADTRGVTAQQVSDAAKTALRSVPAYAVYGVTAGAPSHAAISKLLA